MASLSAVRVDFAGRIGTFVMVEDLVITRREELVLSLCARGASTTNKFGLGGAPGVYRREDVLEVGVLQGCSFSSSAPEFSAPKY